MGHEFATIGKSRTAVVKRATVFGFQDAITGIRLARDSEHLADSLYYTDGLDEYYRSLEHVGIYVPEQPCFGPGDAALLKKLTIAGTEHRKGLRAIQVWIFLCVPIMAGVDLDTYKVGTVRLSRSTRHTPRKRPFTLKDFYEEEVSEATIVELNELREKWLNHLNTGDQRREYLQKMKGRLPGSYLMEYLWQVNYEVLLAVYRQRRDHPLKCLRELCQWSLDLPLFVWLVESLGLLRS